MSRRKKIDSIMDEIPEDDRMATMKRLSTPSISNIEYLTVAGCSDNEIAGLFRMTDSEYSTLLGSVIQDDPNFSARLDNLRNARHALSKVQIAERIMEGDIEMSKWDLQTTHKDYNQKLTIDNNVNVHELTDDEKILLSAMLPGRVIDVTPDGDVDEGV